MDQCYNRTSPLNDTLIKVYQMSNKTIAAVIVIFITVSIISAFYLTVTNQAPAPVLYEDLAAEEADELRYEEVRKQVEGITD